MPAIESSLLPARYFDGVSARAHAVRLQLQDGFLLISGDGIQRSLALSDVQWPERTRHGGRVAYLKDGGSVQCADSAAWDHWRRLGGAREPLVVKLQQSWRWVLACTLMLVALLVLLQQWGLPVLSRALVAATPLSVDQSLGEASLALIDGQLMRPSKLLPAEQARLQAALAQAVSAMPAGSVPTWQLVFRQSRIGPNAFALPGGTLVMTDELVELVERDDKVITAVLAHELGHVRHRHGLRMLIQTAALSGLAGVVLGDFSSVLAGMPVLLGQASYSREAEREADREAVRVLKAAGISPAVMLTLFDRLEAKRRKAEKGDDKALGQDSWLGIAFASHPPDADRVSYFREAAAGP
ncbi:Peptidase family M48 [Polaromonas sp. OV174]|uniref:M48 family metallopeptidase n=1 Tax=Polaromonas sp. OV174 TaxID=1855300 RepID=UPI0008F05412|nr:M48 family metallopeptidase [Polaromonas sp. OV174]SFB95052.1 Peptidase family M48 [Polaromonas sp. OV174]